VTLLALAAGRRAALRRRLLQQSIDIACPPGSQQQTCRTLLLRSIAGTDIQTDRRTPYRYDVTAAYYASRSVCKTLRAIDNATSAGWQVTL